MAITVRSTFSSAATWRRSPFLDRRPGARATCSLWRAAPHDAREPNCAVVRKGPRLRAADHVSDRPVVTGAKRTFGYTNRGTLASSGIEGGLFLQRNGRRSQTDRTAASSLPTL